MHVVVGTDYFGPVDRVRGLFYVATKCTHLCYLPIWPRGSFLVLDETAEGIIGVPVPFSLKSYLYGWARAILGAAGILGLGLGGAAFVVSPSRWTLIPLAVGALAIALMQSARLELRASLPRAKELAATAGIPESALLRALEEPPPWPERAGGSPGALFEGLSQKPLVLSDSGLNKLPTEPGGEPPAEGASTPPRSPDLPSP